jgi:17beta-estradiol 17-dehydrogenase / very-long-chain 3-oxoacyl-CoA reductase
LEKVTKRGNKSGLINMSSAAGMIIYQGTAHYSATKTYDDVFSESINLEVKNNIDVLTVRPFYVSTPMTKNTTSATHATASQTAKEVVDSLGQVDICYGPFTHRINAAMINLVHEKIVSLSASKSLADFKESYNKKD